MVARRECGILKEAIKDGARKLEPVRKDDGGLPGVVVRVGIDLQSVARRDVFDGLRRKRFRRGCRTAVGHGVREQRGGGRDDAR